MHVFTALLATTAVFVLCFNTSTNTEEKHNGYVMSLVQYSMGHIASHLIDQLLYVSKQVFDQTSHCRPRHTPVEQVPIPRSPCGVLHPHSPVLLSQNWTFTVHHNFDINVTILRFNLTNSVEHCRAQSLYITWSRKDSGKLTSARYCGVRSQWTLSVINNEANLLYFTDGFTFRGEFLIAYQIFSNLTQDKLFSEIFNFEEYFDSYMPRQRFQFRRKLTFKLNQTANTHVSILAFSLSYLFADQSLNEKTSFIIFRLLPSYIMDLYVRQRDLDFFQAKYSDLLYNLDCFDGPSSTSPRLLIVNGGSSSHLHMYNSSTVSSGFLVACRLTYRPRQCLDTAATCKHLLLMDQRWFPNPLLNQYTYISDQQSLTFPTNSACNSVVCLMKVSSSSKKPLSLTVSHLKLPDIDHSNDCLYEGAAIIEELKHMPTFLPYLKYHDTGYAEAINTFDGFDFSRIQTQDKLMPVLRLCGKVPIQDGGSVKEGLITNTLVGMGSSLIIALYSFHRHGSIGNMELIAKEVDCPGVYISCLEITTLDLCTTRTQSYCLPTITPPSLHFESRDMYNIDALTRYPDGSQRFSETILVSVKNALVSISGNDTHTFNVVAMRPSACATNHSTYRDISTNSHHSVV